MDTIVTAGADRSPERKSGGCLEDLDRSLLVSNLLAQRLDLRQLLSRRTDHKTAVDTGLDHPAAQRLRSRHRQRVGDLSHRPLPIQDFFDSSTTELWRVLRWRAMTAVSYPRSLKPRNEHCIKPGATQQTRLAVAVLG